MKRITALCLLASLFVSSQPVLGWDYENHRVINQLALASLPTNFPAFVQAPAAAERIAFLAGEPDRWRNSSDLSVRHHTFPDHYMDLEELADYGLKPELLPVFRYDFVADLALFRKAHPDKFAGFEAAQDKDHTRGLVGTLPWALTESYSKLKSGFSCLKAYEEDGGTADEIANAQANILYVMGVMGHYAGDASQPLHLTLHHHGWVGDNPQHFSTNRGIHSWIDGGYLLKVGGADVPGLKARLRPARLPIINGHPAKAEETFQAIMLFLIGENKLVETVYQMDKDGKLSGEGDKGLQGKAFLEEQMLKSGQLLGDLWYAAWQEAPSDTFLKTQLARRKHGSQQK